MTPWGWLRSRREEATAAHRVAAALAGPEPEHKVVTRTQIRFGLGDRFRILAGWDILVTVETATDSEVRASATVGRTDMLAPLWAVNLPWRRKVRGNPVAMADAGEPPAP